MKTRLHVCDPSIIVSQQGTHVFFTYTKENKEVVTVYPTIKRAIEYFKQVTRKKAGRPQEVFPKHEKWYHQIFKL